VLDSASAPTHRVREKRRAETCHNAPKWKELLSALADLIVRPEADRDASIQKRGLDEFGEFSAREWPYLTRSDVKSGPSDVGEGDEVLPESRMREICISSADQITTDEHEANSRSLLQHLHAAQGLLSHAISDNRTSVGVFHQTSFQRA
jgi:hypothetical protein